MNSVKMTYRFHMEQRRIRKKGLNGMCVRHNDPQYAQPQAGNISSNLSGTQFIFELKTQGSGQQRKQKG